MLRQHYTLRLVSCKNCSWSGTQAADEGPPRVRDVVTATHVQSGELRELSNVRKPRVRDVATVTQVQASELRELGNVLQSRVRDLAALVATHVQAGELRELGNVL